ncbi:MAG TPA: DUF2279 domain-containing protein [Chitinophagales bacterium]|nr:DUF2279 domain-containing protein [Chitinophagales bacterium]
MAIAAVKVSSVAFCILAMTHNLKPFILPAIMLLCCNFSFSQTQRFHFTERAPSFCKKRFWGVTGSILGVYGATLAGLNHYWYKDYPRTSFHFFNDGREWLGIDKAGHVFGAYFASRWAGGMYRWTGMNDRAAILTGGVTGAFLLSSVEVLDAFSSKWGFSGWDLLANFAGSALVIGQEFAWHDQRIVIKLSALPQDYPDEVKSRTDYLFGNSKAELFLKDYNAVTTWASANVKSFMKKERRFPPWLNIAFGYGASGMLGGFDNRWCSEPQQTPYCECSDANKADRSDIERYPQFYLSLDVDFTRVKTTKPAIKVLLQLLNLIKVPSPTLEFNRTDGVVFHPLFF